jgi:DNA-binding GntR family transcriptional regulator
LSVASNPSLASAAYNAIQRDLIRCALLPGSEFTENALASRYQFGKTPIRQALARLAQEGMVRILPRRGYLVNPISIKDVEDIFYLRLLLETDAVRLAAGRVDAVPLRRLDEICRAGYDPADPQSAAEFLRANTEFHVTIAHASGNDRLATIVAQLLRDMERLFHVGLRLRNRSEEMAHEHRDLVDALVAGDGASASAITATQIEAARKMVMDGLLSSTHLMTVSLSSSSQVSL